MLSTAPANRAAGRCPLPVALLLRQAVQDALDDAFEGAFREEQVSVDAADDRNDLVDVDLHALSILLASTS
jgi:hypothetical protein